MDELFGMTAEPVVVKPYSIQPSFYLGTVVANSTNFANVRLDGWATGKYRACTKPTSVTYSANQRVVIMEAGGAYIILAAFT